KSSNVHVSSLSQGRPRPRAQVAYFVRGARRFSIHAQNTGPCRRSRVLRRIQGASRVLARLRPSQQQRSFTGVLGHLGRTLKLFASLSPTPQLLQQIAANT